LLYYVSCYLQNLMREYMRNNDRAISNIEALPGGFNALRQLYENVQVFGHAAAIKFRHIASCDLQSDWLAAGRHDTTACCGSVQEPLLNATTRPDSTGNPLAALLGGAAAGSAAATSTSGTGSAAAADQPGGQPLPNPWAPQGTATGV
jgi:ubiquilin